MRSNLKNFFGNYVNNFIKFKGRASRLEFLFTIIVNKLGESLLVIFFTAPFLLYGMDDFSNISGILIALVFWVANLSVTVRRLHDFNISGWWILLAGIIPVLAVGAYMVYQQKQKSEHENFVYEEAK